MQNRYCSALGVLLACSALGSAGAYARDRAPDSASPPGLEAVEARIRVHLPPAEAATLIERIEILASGPADVLQADGSTLSRRDALEQELAAVTQLPDDVRAEVADAVIATGSESPSSLATDPAASPDAAMPGILPGTLANAARGACEDAAREYANRRRAGTASPAGEDLIALARQRLAGTGLEHDLAFEIATLQCIERRAAAMLAAGTKTDSAALDAANQPQSTTPHHEESK